VASKKQELPTGMCFTIVLVGVAIGVSLVRGM